MAAQLVTDELSAVNDQDFRKNLISNFVIIQDALDEFRTTLTNSETNQEDSQNLSSEMEKLTQRINRIAMGTDEDTVRLVVTAILKEQEVIK